MEKKDKTPTTTGTTRKNDVKKYTLGFAKVNRPTWQHIKNGEKTVETRAATIKYSAVKAGDFLIFSCAGKKFQKKIKKVTHFKTIEEMLKVYNSERINPGVKTLAGMKAMYASYSGYTEKIAEFGLLAFELE